mmetsp:Transcript_43028/g.68815  ORF Transcript_43028/g.68815 Transcript_43028/m.68815 type:complete len:83 (+) Transcript_43028:491-739(+)
MSRFTCNCNAPIAPIGPKIKPVSEITPATTWLRKEIPSTILGNMKSTAAMANDTRESRKTAVRNGMQQQAVSLPSSSEIAGS